VEQESRNLRDGADESGGAASVPSAPGERDPAEDRNAWLTVLADMHDEYTRRCDSLSARIAKVEKKSLVANLDPEIKALALMLAFYVGVSYVLPLIGELVRKWHAGDKNLFPGAPVA
jgi:hypothetical protein